MTHKLIWIGLLILNLFASRHLTAFDLESEIKDPVLRRLVRLEWERQQMSVGEFPEAEIKPVSDRISTLENAPQKRPPATQEKALSDELRRMWSFYRLVVSRDELCQILNLEKDILSNLAKRSALDGQKKKLTPNEYAEFRKVSRQLLLLVKELGVQINLTVKTNAVQMDAAIKDLSLCSSFVGSKLELPFLCKELGEKFLLNILVQSQTDYLNNLFNRYQTAPNSLLSTVELASNIYLGTNLKFKKESCL